MELHDEAYSKIRHSDDARASTIATARKLAGEACELIDADQAQWACVAFPVKQIAGRLRAALALVETL